MPLPGHLKCFGGISFRCQRELCNFQCGLQLPAFYRIQADNGSQKSGNPGKVDIEQFSLPDPVCFLVVIMALEVRTVGMSAKAQER